MLPCFSVVEGLLGWRVVCRLFKSDARFRHALRAYIQGCLKTYLPLISHSPVAYKIAIAKNNNVQDPQRTKNPLA